MHRDERDARPAATGSPRKHVAQPPHRGSKRRPRGPAGGEPVGTEPESGVSAQRALDRRRIISRDQVVERRNARVTRVSFQRRRAEKRAGMPRASLRSRADGDPAAERAQRGFLYGDGQRRRSRDAAEIGLTNYPTRADTRAAVPRKRQLWPRPGEARAVFGDARSRSDPRSASHVGCSARIRRLRRALMFRAGGVRLRKCWARARPALNWRDVADCGRQNLEWRPPDDARRLLG